MFYCVASPYSGNKKVQQQRVDITARLTFSLMKQGIPVFSLTIHNDTLTNLNAIDKADYADVFSNNAKALILQSKGLIVLQLDGWEESHGVQTEVKRAEQNGIPVIYLSEHDIIENRENILKIL